MNLPYKLESGLYKTPDGKGFFFSAYWITTTYDGFYTILGSANPLENITVSNNYPRFTSVEKAEEYWNKIKHESK